MNENIEKILSALVEAVERLKDQPTGEAVAADPKNAFKKTPAQEDKDKNKALAKEISEANAKEAEQAEKEKGRKITKEILPISIVGIDKKALAALADIIPKATEQAKEQEKPKEEGSGLGMALLKGLAYTAFAAIVGPVMALFGFFEEINKQKWFIKLKDFVKSKFWEPIKKLFKPVGDFFTKIKNSKFVQAISTTIDDMWKGIKDFGGKIKKFFKPVTDFVDDIIKSVKNFGDKIKKFFEPIKKAFGFIGKIFGGGAGAGGGSIFSKIASFFDPTKNPVIKGIMGFAKGLGKVLGKIFLPITIIMEAFNFITGFMDGYEEGGVIGGLEQGVTDVFNSLIGWPLDMLKSGLSWILGAFGFEEAEAALDAFSFQELFDKMFDNIFGYVKNIFGNLTGAFDKIMAGDIMGGFGDIGKMVGGILLMPWDLLKDGVSWLLSAFGWDEGAEALDSFSFTDIFNQTFDGIFNFFKAGIDWVLLLFSEPKKAFKQVADWFDKLFKDPLGTIKEMLPQWMIDFGGWIYDTAIKPIADFFGGVADDPETAKKSMLSYLPEWMTGFAGWVFDNYIMPIVNYFDKLLSGDIAGAFAALIPPWLKDFGGWLYDNTIGKIMQFFNGVKNNSEGMKQNFLAMLPSWMTGFGTWIWDNAIKPIADFFNTLFADPAGTIKSLIPEWVLDIAGWLYNNALAPIVNWFGTLFDDPLATFSAMIPDWVKDIGGWIGGKLSGIWDGLTGIFDAVTNFDFTSMIPDWIMDFIGDDEKEAFGKAQEKAKQKTAEDLSKAGLGQDVGKMVAEEMDKAKRDEGGADYAKNAEKYEEELKDLIVDGERLSGEQHTAVMNAFKHGGFGFKGSKLYKDVEKSIGGTIDVSNAKHREIIMKQLKNVKDDETFGDDINDDYDESLRLLGLASAGAQYGARVENRGIASIVKGIRKVGGLNLGGEFFKLDGTTPVTPGMIDGLLKMHSDTNANMQTLVKALTALKITPESLTSRMDKQKAAGEEEPQPTGPVAMDFISRPGQDPLFFDKGDIVMGMHQDVRPPVPAQSSGTSDESTRQLVNNSKELVTRMDNMVTIMNQHSEIHGRILEVLTEAGLVDKQGNTVVNNGGNSTVTNISTQQSNIMNFRDQVVGRLSSS